jgi:putative copper export protein
MLDALAASLKAALYVGLLSGAGAAFAEATLRPAPPATEYLLRIMRLGAGLTLGACLAGTLVLILRLGGQFDEPTLSAVFRTNSGAAIVLQVAGSVLLLIPFAEDAYTRVTRVSNAVLAASSFAFSGHAASSGAVDGLVAFLHVSVAAWWLGSLWLLRYECTRGAFSDVTDVLQRFSRIATLAVGALAIAGVLLIMILVDFSRDPWLTPYGRMLAVKLGIAAIVFALAAHNRYRLTPRVLAGDTAATASLRKTIAVEFALIGAILIVTAFLTTYLSPHE